MQNALYLKCNDGHLKKLAFFRNKYFSIFNLRTVKLDFLPGKLKCEISYLCVAVSKVQNMLMSTCYFQIIALSPH